MDNSASVCGQLTVCVCVRKGDSMDERYQMLKLGGVEGKFEITSCSNQILFKRALIKTTNLTSFDEIPKELDD